MLVRAVRASWACLGSALGRSDVPAVPRGRSGRSAQRPRPCTRPPLGTPWLACGRAAKKASKLASQAKKEAKCGSDCHLVAQQAANLVSSLESYQKICGLSLSS